MAPMMRVLFAAAEVAPLAKAGGLADVVGSLPKALARLSIDVRVMLPKYGQIDTKRFAVRKRTEEFRLRFDGIDHVVRLYEATLPGSDVPVLLLDHPHYEGAGDIYYQEVRNTVEQQTLQVERFLFFSRAVLRAIEVIDWRPDLLHTHDWHTAAIPYFLRREDASTARPIATVHTIHNLPLRGTIRRDRLTELLGADRKGFVIPDGALDRDTINISGLGIAAADLVTTVSPTYAKEILTPEYGAGMERILARRGRDLVGILNGIDDGLFDPAHDPHILPYTTATLDRKEENTKRLLRRANLSERRPLLGMVSRLTSQKGIALICDILPRLVELGCGVVILGTGEPELEARLRENAERFPESVHVTIGFDPVYAQEVYAGSDCFLMPSVFEPCGLGQMIALRYGTIPIVHATGGLKDTVQEGEKGTGFVFENLTSDDFLAACSRAIARFADKRSWRALQEHAMEQDFSWATSAQEYARRYEETLRRYDQPK